MNETLQVIKNRRSIRAFKAEQIRDSALGDILEAGLSAPNAMNSQKWHFTVVQKMEVIDQMAKDIADIMKSSGNPAAVERASKPDFNVFYKAPTVIILSAEENYNFAKNDCSTAAQNMFLAAESLNIGSCWINGVVALFSSEKGANYKKELGIPNNYDVICSVSLGYKAMENSAPSERSKAVINYVK